MTVNNGVADEATFLLLEEEEKPLVLQNGTNHMDSLQMVLGEAQFL